MKSIPYYSKAAYTGNGSTTQYSAPFPYISKAHVFVTVDDTSVAYTWLNEGTVKLATAPANGSSVVVKRITPRDTRLVDFADGSYLTEKELDLSALQLLYLIQEALDGLADTLYYDFSGNWYDAKGRRIINLGEPLEATDAVTKGYVDEEVQALWDKVHSIEEGTGGDDKRVSGVSLNRTEIILALREPDDPPDEIPVEGVTLNRTELALALQDGAVRVDGVSLNREELTLELGGEEPGPIPITGFAVTPTTMFLNPNDEPA